MSSEIFKKQQLVQHKFWEAFRKDDVETVAKLLDPDAGHEVYPNVDEVLSINYPVLISLCENNVQMLNELFMAGANLDVASTNGWHFAHELATKDNIKLVTGLLPHIELNRVTPEGVTPMMVAVENANWEVVDLFLNSDKNLKLYSQDNQGNSVFHRLLKEGNVAVTEKILDKFSDVVDGFRKNQDGKTPFDYLDDPDIQERLYNKVNSNFTNLMNTAHVQDALDGRSTEELKQTVEEIKPIKKPMAMGLGGIKKNF